MAIISSDQVSVLDISDAFSVILTSESHTFPGSTSAALAGSVTTQIIVMRGTKQVAASVVLSEITKPAGVSVSSDNDAVSPTLTISVTTAVKTGGVIRIPVHIEDVTITKEFAFAIAFKGATGATGGQGPTGPVGPAGKGVSSTAATYQASSSGTTVPTGVWSNTPPVVSANSYLWTKLVLTYTDGTTSDPVYTVAKQGATGSAGSPGSVWYSGTAITGTSTTPAVFSGTGIAAAKVNDQYLNSSTGYTYKCTVAGAASAAKWIYTGSIKGPTGQAGADAITMSIISSNGTVFKNTEISTVLTAHVYRAGTELNANQISALGTIKWYKDGGTTAVGTGPSLTIDAGDVTNKASYVAQLEG